ncbi:unnamed protein product [Candida verbasci]|uniref:Alpha-mannosidase n=1 Tax=Candida verbasci TaxID=1227364 RepID=A0A9W4TYE1_9ASCO|nr:unnamed protein product [Candida verbasci]
MSYSSFNHQPNFKPIDHLYVDRLRQFTDTGGQYHNLNLTKFYDIKRTQLSNLKAWKVPDDKDGKTLRPLFKDINFKEVEWQDIGLGFMFGPSWKSWWVKFELIIPQDYLKYEGLEIEWDSSSEGLIYNSDGLPLQAFTGGDRNIFSLPEQYRITKPQVFFIEVACNGMFGNGAEGEPDPNRYFRLNKAHLVVPNLEARRLFYDFWIIGDAAREFPNGAWQKYQAADVANRIMNVFDPENVNSIKDCRKLAQQILGSDINSDEVFNKNPFPRIDVFGVGNCHIDTAWEWPFAETKRKIVRSWTTQLKICDEYPEYVFVASQMQQFKWLKELHPEILDQIHEKFKLNQFIPIGGSWVENDTNLPNGESLIRQFLLGQNWLLEEFGFQSGVFWLPDTFGYSSQIPQICQIVGIEKFLTQKLSWNNINTFPLSTFNWKGIDGSQVLVHMPPANTYTALAHFGDVVRSSTQNKNMRNVPTSLLLYGFGDGGGGPTPEMIEKLRRCRGLANTNGLIPTVELGVTIDDFYDHILENSNQGSELPTWTGEIYLEFHRGTYTTQANIKKFMRLGEIKLHDLELIASLTSIKYPKDYQYPSKELRILWENLCLCQFHDVLPGSCIGMVYYDEVYPMLTKLLKEVDLLTFKALRIGKEKSNSPSVVNTLPWDRYNEIIHVEKEQDEELFAQLKKDKVGILSNDRVLKVSVDHVSGKSQFNKKLKYPASITRNDSFFILSNKLLTVKISNTGILTSLYDEVNQREIIDTTKTNQTYQDNQYIGGNQFILFDDQPLNFPAWDTELYSLEKFKLLTGSNVEILTNDELESSLIVTHKISADSHIKTTISLAGSNQEHSNSFVKFASTVEWHETYKFLKVQFPITLNTTLNANYETQFGLTSRPTHFNTTWDIARFEVCHHKFMDLSEYNYGVSILNNSKYGAAIHGNLMRLSLLRSPKAPDNKADMGTHHFEYAIYPHNGPLSMDTVKLGWNFNYKLVPKKSYDSELFNLIKLETEGSLVLSHVKRGEYDDGISNYKSLIKKGEKSLVLRVYEALGGKSNGTIVLDKGLGVKSVFKTCGLERDIEELKIGKDGKVDIELKAFEIATFKLYLK